MCASKSKGRQNELHQSPDATPSYPAAYHGVVPGVATRQCRQGLVVAHTIYSLLDMLCAT